MIWGIDVGGTNIKLGLFLNEQLINHFAIPTNITNKGEEILKEIKDFILNYHEENEIPFSNVKGIGFGVPGPVKDNFIIRCPNIGWENKYLVKEFKELLNIDIPVYVANDANMAAFGEYKKLNIKENIVFITLGTGVGGAVIVDGKILEGSHGSAAELGHIQVDYINPQKCSCGLTGCLETVCAINGLIYLAKKAYYKKEFKTSLTKYELRPIEIFEAAKKGDELALAIVKEYTDYLAKGAATTAIITDPSVVLIGGGISNAGEILLTNLKEAYLKHAHYGVKDVKFELAKLGNQAGMYGAYYLVKENV